MEPLVRRFYLALGRVQGVNYRVRVAEAARRHALTGSVRNRSDGSVFIDVQGPEAEVEAFLREVAGPSGPSDAREVRLLGTGVPAPDATEFSIDRGAG